MATLSHPLCWTEQVIQSWSLQNRTSSRHRLPDPESADPGSFHDWIMSVKLHRSESNKTQWKKSGSEPEIMDGRVVEE